ncbi:23S rRNA pseudouridine2605 synthase [Pararhizobium capsulatum DSM 1112]|uniref:Pseudouridine synthase n=1 Tax=Pararhizobium capsulatum DSM 1112 TaxID=1121113 RepID=A0ABU0BM44_9HYPH|nr:pseudouridine synthase [Pararhizobium capsulatum]MDQ0319321.1 23S rRNA pseudouridine2605 synthase [Pararhizobium capsulatum DSM 1112]
MTPKDKSERPGAKRAGQASKFSAGKPRSDKPYGDKADRADKPYGAKPFGDKPRGGKPVGAKSAPRSPKPEADADRPRRPRPAAAETASAAPDEPQRISKILARVGVASRRDIERMIMEGRVSLNGKVLDSPVVNVTLADKIEVDGQPIRGIERTRLWLYHKPAGLVTTNSDPEGRATVFDRLPEDLPRVLSIGRLDINTEGLLLLTNDGGLARVLELPATGWLRRYRVRAHGEIDQAGLDKLKDGIAVDGVLYGSIEATLDKVQGSNVWITMGLREGKNREIKNVLGALGLEVNRLIRISYGPFQLGELAEGHAQEIRGRTLRDQLGPRLIEDAKANFEAPIFDAAPEEEEKPKKTERPAWGGEDRGGFREKPSDKRERALSRLDTRRDERGGGRPDRKGGRDEAPSFADRPKREPAHRARKTNVWMAPGARPVAEKKPKGTEAAAADTPLRRERPEGAPKSKRYGRNNEGQLVKSGRKFDPDRKRPSSMDRPDSGPRVVVKRAEDDNDWIRGEEAPQRDDRRDGGDRKRGFGGDDRKPRDFGDRPPRREGAGGFSDRARGDRPDGERPRKPFGDKPAGGRPFREGGDRKPRDFGDRPEGDRPRGKSFGGKSFGGDKPAGARPAGKPFGAKSGGPRGGKPGGRPAGGKPSGRPSGSGKPAGGGKPRGRGN